MAKYRLLRMDELQELEKEFVNYLIINGITADEWVRLKEEEKDKAERIIELFSDVVFEGMLRKIKFLEFWSKNSVVTFQCLPEKMVMMGMKAEQDSEVDFTDKAFLDKALQNPPEGLKIFSQEKPYKKEREQELFDMTQDGCVVTDGKLFKALCLAMLDQ